MVTRRASHSREALGPMRPVLVLAKVMMVVVVVAVVLGMKVEKGREYMVRWEPKKDTALARASGSVGG